MFEKEAEKYAEENKEIYGSDEYADITDYNNVKEAFQKGAEFGYNKANTWHYPSKGEYPKENKRYLCKIKVFVGGGITYECLDYDTEYNSWKDACGDIIAWKEITDPQEI